MVHGIVQRLETQVQALARVADRIDCLFLTAADQRLSPEELSGHEERLRRRWSSTISMNSTTRRASSAARSPVVAAPASKSSKRRLTRACRRRSAPKVLPDTEIVLRSDPAALAEECVRLLRDPLAAEQLGLAARAKARLTYERKAVVAQLERLFAGALGAGSGTQRPSV